MTQASGPALLELIRAQDWKSIDYHARLVVLHEVNTTITRLRKKSGLAPLDDPLPGERENVFRTIRAILGKFPRQRDAVPGALPANSGSPT